MTDWTWEEPGEGELDGLAQVAAAFRQHAGDAWELLVTVSGVRSTRQTVWTGEAAVAWDAAVTPTTAELTELSTCAAPMADAIDGYVAAVLDIQYSQQLYLNLRTTARARAAELGLRCRPTMDGRAAIVEAVDPTRVQTKAELAEMDEIQGTINTALRGLHELAEDRRAAEATCVASLDAALPGGWGAERAAFGAVGITDFGKMTAANAAKAMERFVRDALAEGGALTAEDLANLSLLLTKYAAQPEVLSSFIDRLGGDGLVDLIDAVGAADCPGSLPLARQLRDALRTASSDWEPWQARSFADAMFEDSFPGNGRPLSISFLFDGPPYPGRELSLAASAQVDAWERENGEPFLEDPATEQSWAGRTSPGGLLLIEADHADDPEGLAAAHDAAGRILEALGAYPEHASRFLTEDRLGPGRIEYWFHQRDWSVYDGFEGPSALLAGTQQVPGGPGQPSVPPDDTALTGAAELMTQLMNALGENSSLDSGAVNSNASLSLAEAVALNFAAIWDSPNDEEVQQLLGSGSSTERALAFSAKSVPCPLITLDALQTVLGAAGSRGTGASALSGTMEAYRAALVQAAANSGESVDQQITGVAGRLAEAQAMIDGSINAAAIAEAAGSDEATRTSINQVLTAIAVAASPWTFGTSIPAVATTTAVVTGLAQAAEAGAGALLATDAASAAAAMHDDQQAQYLAAMRLIGETAATLLGLDSPRPAQGDTSDEAYQEAVSAWFASINDQAVNNPDPAQRMSDSSDLDDILEDYVTERWGAGG
ncbi:hypothetical protein SAMN06295974_3918 [Plantibacter flavus]|uniref:Uncharacterized protein n=1 Tax=Plantibacter flavus TaxID=150123 RepID=A0A3N2BYA6_9MICO|nr:hypothetical protein [Plantibacter flavus]ROR80231.1 hypothetical protein EDD42_0268 [Plantibacter flavus]SMG50342.1 hypothetical protein SAMN06295974_3918 [Plantibacter flavus]